jgi:hypothetical protein
MKEFKLNNAKKIQSGFKAPEGYFDTTGSKCSKRLPEGN